MSTSPSSNAGTNNVAGAVVHNNSQVASTEHSVDTTIFGVAGEIWSQLVVALLVEKPASISSYYNYMIKHEYKSDFKLLSSLLMSLSIFLLN
jgi:hypothetical protein